MNAILEIIQRWQDPGPWATVKALATQAEKFDSQAVKLGGDARFLLDRGDIEQARQLKAESDHLRNCAANVLNQRHERASEFMQIENWVREHRPELLEFVPTATFEGEHTEAVRDLKRLESRIRKPAAAETPKTGSHPLSPPKEKWPREEYARDAIIRLRSDTKAKGNVAAFCREIAAEQGIPEIATSLKKLLYSKTYKSLWQ
jgi:hypothetical protein